MDMNAYQQAALRTAATKDTPNEVFHLLLGLVGETGEIEAPQVLCRFYTGCGSRLRAA